MKNVLEFGKRAALHVQSEILEGALEAIRRSQGGVAAFDLDSTLLSNKVRQARILREFGAERGDARLKACPPEAIVSWDLRDSMRLCGLGEQEAGALYGDAKEFWRQRFFTSAYCQDDLAVPGAAAFLHSVLARGGRILYLTGRHGEMGPGTIESFRRAGFPLPGVGPVELWLKPVFEDDDDAFKALSHARLRGNGGIAAAFDNEPTHVNAYKTAFPDAYVVHLDTDHSGRPVEVLPSIPSVADFNMER
jgi:hypothetical protein